MCESEVEKESNCMRVCLPHVISVIYACALKLCELARSHTHMHTPASRIYLQTICVEKC